MQTAFVTVIFKTLGLIRLSHELQKWQIPKLSCTNCMTIQVTVRAWSHDPGWLALPSWLLSWYYMKRANPELPLIYFCIEIGSNAHEQCVTHCPVPLLVHLPGHPANVITWNISTWDPSITTLGSQLTGLAWFSNNRNFDFCWLT